MTKSSTPSALKSAGDTEIAKPVAAESVVGGTNESKSRSVKPLVLVAAGSVASVVAFVVYRKLNRPVPKSEQIARKVRKYVKYLEKQDFEFPKLPPHLRKAVTKKSHAAAVAGKKLTVKAAKTGKKLSVKTAKAAKSHWRTYSANARKAIHS